MNRYRIVFFILSLTLYIPLCGQDKQENTLNQFLEKFSTVIRTQEKQQAYLVTDKSVFRAGETIWFKAFLLNALSQRAYTKSRFLFVDLVNEKDSIVKSVILDPADRQLNSRMDLAFSVPAGYYWMRAYTRRMTEENAEGICVRPIYIFSNTNSSTIPKMHKNADSQDSLPAITFYPEGNCIITGVNSTVAMRVIYKNSESVVTEGYVKDNRDTVVTRFTTNNGGLGKFAFEPSGYRKYRAVINWRGKEISYPLPSFNFYGGQLAVTKRTGSYTVRIMLGDSIYRKDAVTYVVGASKDSLVFASVGKGQYEVSVENSKLIHGIFTFYLFDKDFKLLSERSVYVADNDLQVKLSVDKDLFSKREKGLLNIAVTDAQQHPIPSIVAVSVTDTLLSVVDEKNIFNGTACSPKAPDNIYISRNGDFSEENIDLWMLTRNNTYQTLNSTSPGLPGADIDSLLYIKGVVLNEKLQAAGNKLVTLVSKSKDPFLYTDTTDSNGRFRFPLEKYADSTEFIIEAKNLDGSALTSSIICDPIAYPKLKTPLCLKQYLPVQPQLVRKYFKTYLADEWIEGEGKSLAPVTVKNTEKIVNYDESKRISKNSVILASDRINERSKIGDVVMMVGGLQILNGFLVMLGPSELTRSIGPQSEPMLILNGAQASNTGTVLQYLNSLNPRDIDFIEVMKGPEASIFGVRGGNGAISINTRNREKDLNSGGNGIKSFYAKGISNAVYFPNTGYEKKNKKAAIIADNRSTLFWSGNYLADGTHVSPLTFYTNDIASAYRVTVTGVTINGDIVYKTMIFQNK